MKIKRLRYLVPIFCLLFIALAFFGADAPPKKGETVALSYTHRIQPFIAEYSAETHSYQVTLLFVAKGAVDALGVPALIGVITDEGFGDYSGMDWTVPHIKLPANLTLEHRGKNVWGAPYSSNVICWPVGRRVGNTTTGEVVEVSCSFEGRVTCTHRVSSRTQMVSEILAQSLKESGAVGEERYAAIGPNFQGIGRDIPMLVYTVTESVPMLLLDTIISNANLIAGSVNERNWQPPWQFLPKWYYNINDKYPPVCDEKLELWTLEGDYLYLGPADVSIDRRTRTALISHSFVRLQSRRQQHIYKWFGYEQVINEDTGKLDRKYDLTPSGADIQFIAGTDKWWDGCTTIPEFSTLNLEEPRF